MKKTFDLKAEQDYYKLLPSELVITPDHIVDLQMQLCTGNPSWPLLLTNNNVLEVGSGECSYLNSFLKVSTPSLYVAQDIFRERMIIAKNEGGYPNVDFVVSDVLKLPFESQSFDLCLAFGLLHHIPNIKDALIEIARVLKIGGFFIFRDPYAQNPAIWLKYKFWHHSENESPISWRRIKKDFRDAKFNIVYMNRFWLRYPKLPPGPWSVNIGGLVRKT
jgi:ubiquinone/menaquinone biosynthesis C-methylase UbiE